MNTKAEAPVSQDETGKRNVSFCYWKILMIYTQNDCVGEFFCVLNWIWTVSHWKTWPLFPRESAVNNRLYFQQYDALKCVQRTVLQKKICCWICGETQLKKAKQVLWISSTFWCWNRGKHRKKPVSIYSGNGFKHWPLKTRIWRRLTGKQKIGWSGTLLTILIPGKMS